MAKKTAAKKPAPTKAPAKRGKKPDLSFIAEGLRPLAEPIDALVLNPNNANKHDAISVGVIVQSLSAFGFREPLVVNRKGSIVLAGNGRLLAAKELGYSHVPVVWVADDPHTATGYAIADNRTAEFSEWDTDRLAAQLAELRTAGEIDDLLDTLMLDELVGSAEETPDTSPQLGTLNYQVIVECRDEAHQAELLDELREQGLAVKALTT